MLRPSRRRGSAVAVLDQWTAQPTFNMMVSVDDDVIGEVTVTLYADGSRGMRLSPPHGSLGTVELLRQAAASLTHSADLAEAERLPVVCVTCGTTAVGVIADTSGKTVLLPCRHAVEL
jgi:hypothetical protein